MPELVNDALSLEYKLNEGCALGDLQIADVMNDTALKGIGWILRGRLEEQRGNLLLVREVGPLFDDGADLSLIRLDAVESLGYSPTGRPLAGHLFRRIMGSLSGGFTSAGGDETPSWTTRWGWG